MCYVLQKIFEWLSQSLLVCCLRNNSCCVSPLHLRLLVKIVKNKSIRSLIKKPPKTQIMYMRCYLQSKKCRIVSKKGLHPCNKTVSISSNFVNNLCVRKKLKFFWKTLIWFFFDKFDFEKGIFSKVVTREFVCLLFCCFFDKIFR